MKIQFYNQIAEIETYTAKNILKHFIQNDLLTGDTLAEMLQVIATHFPKELEKLKKLF